MAILSVTPKPDRSGSINLDNALTLSRSFKVNVSSALDGAVAVLASVSINPGDIYTTGTESNPNVVCLDKSCQCVSTDGALWEVTCSYGPRPQQDPNPLNRPPEFVWDFAKLERIAEQTTQGEPILNSAKDAPQEAISRDDSRAVLSVRVNQANFDAALAWSAIDCVNATPFQTAPRGTVKFSHASARQIHDDNLGFTFWDTEWIFEFRAEGWKAIMLDQGYRYLIGNQRKDIMINGKPASEPVLLNGEGLVLLPPTDPPVFNEFEIYHEIPFTIFGF